MQRSQFNGKILKINNENLNEFKNDDQLVNDMFFGENEFDKEVYIYNILT